VVNGVVWINDGGWKEKLNENASSEKLRPRNFFVKSVFENFTIFEFLESDEIEHVTNESNENHEKE
jgi:hypothetical protein